jgi:hypothetical protein
MITPRRSCQESLKTLESQVAAAQAKAEAKCNALLEHLCSYVAEMPPSRTIEREVIDAIEALSKSGRAGLCANKTPEYGGFTCIPSPIVTVEIDGESIDLELLASTACREFAVLEARISLLRKAAG